MVEQVNERGIRLLPQLAHFISNRLVFNFFCVIKHHVQVQHGPIGKPRAEMHHVQHVLVLFEGGCAQNPEYFEQLVDLTLSREQGFSRGNLKQ